MPDKIYVLKFERAFFKLKGFLIKKRTWHRKALMIFGTLRCFVIANLECEKQKTKIISTYNFQQSVKKDMQLTYPEMAALQILTCCI